MAICMCCSKPPILVKPTWNPRRSQRRSKLGFESIGKTALASCRVLTVRASAVDSYESSPDFVKRMEQAWIISQQPRPIGCSSCSSKGHIECKWCAGTGFFIIGDSMLCEVPSRNTSCIICSGKGSMCCSDCKGTGFRAKWLEGPQKTS
ncbi:PREDICTED: uncharacterized protein LOC104803610 [Tarenaya hassleriana]|uniref:uncharacterized protein LOC104803610 n=1 Tax=Tarenaya hassleriana TaxID=28532 RepID=UPI00053C4758|nr:PREDICTED: uncharacterized protein LOC104803610 [Tarenaya hassleriana]